MKLIKMPWTLAVMLCLGASSLFGFGGDAKPVTPEASPEAKALLKFFYDISGKYTLTGQHNYPNTQDKNSEFAAKYIGKTPVVFTTDWGFAKDGDYDSHLARPDIVKEAIKQNRLGSIISICWHAVPPTADEPITFRPIPGQSPDSLASVQGKLLDQQFKDVLTPGTKLYEHWCAQVDTIAHYLKQLQDAHVPILWRPYHEMNGDWFWWGGRRGKYGTAALYRQIFDRLVNIHKLNNLIWIWSVDRPAILERKFSFYYPGNKYIDIVGLDVYGSDFNQSYYDSLVVLSKGKPLVLAEVGNPPTLDILKQQPKWAYYAIWAGMVRNTLKRQYAELVNSPSVLSLEDSTYWNAIAPYRSECGLPPLPIPEARSDSGKFDLSGKWVFDQEKSLLDNSGIGFIPYRLAISQNDSAITVQRTYIVEFANDRITTDTLALDGKEHLSEMFNAPLVTRGHKPATNDSLIVRSVVSFDRGGQNTEMTVDEFWTLRYHGTVLSIRQLLNSPMGKRAITMVFNKE